MNTIKLQIYKRRINIYPTSFAMKRQNRASSGGNDDCKSWHRHCTHSCLAFFKCFNFHAFSKNICWGDRKTFQANCGHQNFLRKHGLDIISVLQKCLWLNDLNRALKIIFLKLGNCDSILAIFFNWYEKITRSYCNITNHVLTCTPSMLLGDMR